MHEHRSASPRFLTAALCFVLSGGLLPLSPPSLAAQGAAEAQIADEMAKQQDIYRTRGAKVPGGYVTSRTLAGYAELLPAAFPAALKNLTPGQRWLDIGAGEGQAILDYYAAYSGKPETASSRTSGRARVIAMSIEDRRTALWHSRAASLGPLHIEYRHGKRLRDYAPDELGRFQIITDVYGGFSYTDHLSLFVEKVLALLEVDGSFFTLLQSVHLEDGKDRPTTWYLTELVDAQGRDVKVCSWLKSISCVKVSCDSMSTWDAPTELIHVRKACGEVSVPRLEPLTYEAGTPPGRKFKLQR